MFLSVKLKRAYEKGLVGFDSCNSEIVCSICDTSFTFIDPSKSVTELFNNNSHKVLVKKLIRNVKLLSKYRPEKYCKIINSLD